MLNKPLYQASPIKEQLREAFKVKSDQGQALLRGRDLVGASVLHPRVHQARQ